MEEQKKNLLRILRMLTPEAGIGLSFRYKVYLLKRNLKKQQVIGCQNLDREIRVIMDEELEGKNTSLSIEYPFICELLNNYKQLKKNLKYDKEKITETAVWRDMKFLFHYPGFSAFSKKLEYFLK